jgi:hypothetical protein
MAEPASQAKKQRRHNQQKKHKFDTCPSPMSGWSAGSTRRLNSSTLSCIASASECIPSLEYIWARLFIANAEHQAENAASKSTKEAQIRHMPLTYVRMLRRQHATMELQHTFLHRKRICMSSKIRVRPSKIAHGRACKSSEKTAASQSTKEAQSQHIPLTYVRMVRRQHATKELKCTFLYRKSIRMSSQFRIHFGKIAHSRACTSKEKVASQ